MLTIYEKKYVKYIDKTSNLLIQNGGFPLSVEPRIGVIVSLLKIFTNGYKLKDTERKDSMDKILNILYWLSKCYKYLGKITNKCIMSAFNIEPLKEFVNKYKPETIPPNGGTIYYEVIFQNINKILVKLKEYMDSLLLTKLESCVGINKVFNSFIRACSNQTVTKDALNNVKQVLNKNIDSCSSEYKAIYDKLKDIKSLFTKEVVFDSFMMIIQFVENK